MHTNYQYWFLVPLIFPFGNREYCALTRRLQEAVSEANTWGKAHGYPLFEKYPHYQEIRSIGKRLNEIGGKRLMQKAYKKVERSIPYPGFSEMWWNGIGRWGG